MLMATRSQGSCLKDERKRYPSEKQTHVKHALAHILLPIFPQMMSVPVPVSSLSHAGNLSQTDTCHVHSPKTSAHQISCSVFTVFLLTHVVSILLPSYTYAVFLLITSPLTSHSLPGIFPVFFFYPSKKYWTFFLVLSYLLPPH